MLVGVLVGEGRHTWPDWLALFDRVGSLDTPEPDIAQADEADSTETEQLGLGG